MPAILAEVPAIPLGTGGRYVAAVYIVLFLIVLIYVAIMATRLSRIERELGELLQISQRPADELASESVDDDEQVVGQPGGPIHATSPDSSTTAGASPSR